MMTIEWRTTHENDEYEDEDQYNSPISEAFHPWVPVILPRMRYAGARNIDTAKDANFLGPSDDYVVSGSDDGNWFMWNKSARRTSWNIRQVMVRFGINKTVKVLSLSTPESAKDDGTTGQLFGPARGESQFSRTS
ncbi:hypothetical protein MPER_04480 [Moniliophthora perniciosa FA553]|nr:hypothetical protein MPER_04480 [Moniliophthora perniciosa FA553]